MTEQTPSDPHPVDQTLADQPLAARNVALDLLEAVLRRKMSLDDALDGHPGLALLEGRDRAFVRLLAATVLRRLGQLDTVLMGFLDRAERPKAGVLDILRLGAAQALFLGTPPHAAVDTSVELAEERQLQPYKGLINAVLRRVVRDGGEILVSQDAGRINTPDWLWLAWRQAYGTARTRAIVEAHLTEAPLDLTLKDDSAAWIEPLEATLLPTGTLRRTAGGAVAELPGYAEGAWWVQDMAAALPAKLFGPVAGLTIYDLCAAPGGKTTQLAAAGAHVVALDRSERRLKRLRENLERVRLSAEMVAADAATWTPAAPADAVLLDAPCSATGAIRRHPDVQRLKSLDDVEKLARAQGRLLAHAVDLVKPGGLLIYCTCSIQPEEGERQIERLLASGAPVERLPVTADEIGGVEELINEHGEIRSLPGMLKDLGGIDGFFVARLRRTSAG
ncbi:MAG TPA: RsmB/NOP family class I SAM-dependent RNA methyltransferase [Azospirillaceae bacterium]|nr:RsmB/NOP family class I SAM-dependent RNA methyltransferase [Azospirillaceae bacterium]